MSDSSLPLEREKHRLPESLPDHKDKPLAHVQANKNRRSLILLLIIFTLPILLAKFALDNQWLDQGVTNKGVLLKNNLTLSQLGIENTELNQQWLILYHQPTACSSYCEQALNTVYNSYVAIGKDKPRVTTVLLTDETIQLAKGHWNLIQPSLQASALFQQAVGKNETIEGSQVYIVDPLGNVILRHAIPKTQKVLSSSQPITSPIGNQNHQLNYHLNTVGKAILADMKKLLKYSKVG
jgi:hypothetical protein